MSDRITWSSRPRSGYPWPLRVREGPLADFVPHTNNHGIGPLPMKAVVELLYRVEEMEYAFSGSGIGAFYPNDPFTASSSGTMTLLDTPTELEVFVANSYWADIEGDPESILMSGGDGGTSEDTAGMQAIRSADGAEIYKDTDLPDSYWLIGYIGIGANAGAGKHVAINSNRTDSGTGSITLKLKCGDFILSTKAPTDGGSATLTASKWFPFATTAGAAAWDTATGAAINGGPGA